MTPARASRRSMLRGAVVTAVAGVVGFIAGRRSAAAHATDSGAANAYGTVPSSGGQALATLDQVSPLTGLVLPDAGIVLTRASDGTPHAFSSVCTHQGCTVTGVVNGAIACPCHGSRFDIRTGAVVAGPAPRPLPAVPIEVRDGQIYTSGTTPSGTPAPGSSTSPPIATPSSTHSGQEKESETDALA